MSNQSARGADEDRDHLDEVEAGAGCAEIWAHLSERRARNEAASCSDD